MGGRAGRPDFHDLGRVVILAEPGGSYSRENPGTEEEIAIKLLKGEMEEVAPEHNFEKSSEEYVEPVLPDLVAHRLVEKRGTKLVMTPLARVMAEHFIGMERLLEIVRLTKVMDDPLEIIAELESEDVHKEKKADPKKSGHKPKESGPSRHGHKRR